MARKYDGTIKNILIVLIIYILVDRIHSIEQITTNNKNNINDIKIDLKTALANNATYFNSILNNNPDLMYIQDEIIDVINKSLKLDRISLLNDTIIIEKINSTSQTTPLTTTQQQTRIDMGDDRTTSNKKINKRHIKTFRDKLLETYQNFANSHTVTVRANKMSRLFKLPRTNSFMAGFGLGFLAFGLKKLLLPVFIGAQIVKSILIAMFLPSILGGLGKLVGKGLSNFSGASSGPHQSPPIDDFDFKDPGDMPTEDEEFMPLDSPHSNVGDTSEYTPASDTSYGYPVRTMNKIKNAMATNGLQQAMNRYTANGHKVQYVTHNSDNYYLHKPVRQHQNFKVFHKIPSSSLLLTTYDPFYSPLLSRLDAIFKQMGIGHPNEKCRERIVCLMYANPAKYAPYSNLVSAQLSRELNELRKPTSDNPDILRFFKYMKAAKDGQDGPSDCPQHLGCPELMQKITPAMLTTYNDINKLVSARSIKL